MRDLLPLIFIMSVTINVIIGPPIDIIRKEWRAQFRSLIETRRRIHLKRVETIAINSKRLSLPIFHAAEINLYTKTQLCERTGGNINVQHAAFDRKRRTRGRGRVVQRSVGGPVAPREKERERERERKRGWKREGNRVTNVSSQFAVSR